ncbi:MAG: cysteine dioxygenase [Alphaproteobacteria bacterium]|nr:cysteine dioxygenase [Alphaproteobacteria bacterium]
MTEIARLRSFVVEMTRLVERHGEDEDRLVERGRELLGELVRHDSWLPDAFAAPNPTRYSQYLLHCDPLERFSVVSFVWGPGQETPVHDHTVWGLIGMMRGAEISQRYARGADGRFVAGHADRLAVGEVEVVSPSRGDIHRVSNALADRPSISIHVYGANIGAVRRHVFDPATGAPKTFISGYSATIVPNLWDRSQAT